MPPTARRPGKFCDLLAPSSNVSQFPVSVSQDAIHIAFFVKDPGRVSLIED